MMIIERMGLIVPDIPEKRANAAAAIAKTG
jgi:hypothetical protein